MKTLVKWSVEDYHRMIEAGILAARRVELLRGDIVEMSPEGPEHYFLVDETSDYLKQLLEGRAIVRFDGPITLMNSEPEPDIAIVRLPKAQYRSRHPQPDDIYWIIEYSNSTLVKDLEEKQQIYAAAKIQEYWVVNLKAKQLKVFREPVVEAYRIERTLTTGDITSLAFPNTAFSVEKILGTQQLP
ncbi:MAG: Uma2 family endonuclease [Leptolyngbyaceae cyanobacterium MO_188.B28]|nr:Uma2 family endonuclease [Leptolyngbyaceae cyanobacterium MO_188.B28]